MTKFNERLKKLRAEKDLTQRQLADELHLSVKTISHYESGYSEPSLDILIKICIYFDIDSDYLLGLKD